MLVTNGMNHSIYVFQLRDLLKITFDSVGKYNNNTWGNCKGGPKKSRTTYCNQRTGLIKCSQINISGDTVCLSKENELTQGFGLWFGFMAPCTHLVSCYDPILAPWMHLV